MTTLELSIAPDYVRWGVWEAIREIIQNAKDAEDRGHLMSVEYNSDKERLTVTSESVKLGRETLVLGVGDKRDDANQRGEFAEGYKLALSTLQNLGKEVNIINSDEVWKPSLAFSQQFNTEVLTITISEAPNENKLSFEIEGISPKQWEQAHSRLLFMPDNDNGDVIPANNGRILKDPKHSGKLYVKGIFVDKLADNYKYGYDLSGVKLDRDRNIPDNWTLKREVRKALKETTCMGTFSPADIFELLSTECGEIGAFANDWDGASEFHEKLKEHFEAVYGNNAVPVESMGESMEAGHFGLKGIVVSKPLASVLGKVIDPFSKIKERKSAEVVKIYSAHELNHDECENFLWAVDLVSKVEENVDANQVSVVDFLGKGMCGLYEGDVKIARRILNDRKELIATMVHEFAHRYGGDGTVQHRDACERMFASIICL